MITGGNLLGHFGTLSIIIVQFFSDFPTDFQGDLGLAQIHKTRDKNGFVKKDWDWKLQTFSDFDRRLFWCLQLYFACHQISFFVSRQLEYKPLKSYWIGGVWRSDIHKKRRKMKQNEDYAILQVFSMFFMLKYEDKLSQYFT